MMPAPASARSFVPRPYQPPMIDHMLQPRVAVWGTPGVGKTGAALAAVNARLMTYMSTPVLVVATLRVARRTWGDECKRWKEFQHLEVSPIIGGQKARLAALERDVPIYTINYESLPWLVDYWGERWPYKLVVADEATKLKSNRLSFQTAMKKDGTPGKAFLRKEGGKRAVALASIAHSHVKEMIELTGTPSPNGLKDLWGQVWYLDRGRRLGRTYTEFMKRWFEKDFDGYSVAPRESAKAQIFQELQDLCLTVEARDYFDLKEPVIVEIPIELPGAVRDAYNRMERKLIVTFEEGQTVSAAHAAVKTQKLLQITNGAAYLDPDEEVPNPMARKDFVELHDEKLQALQSIVDELNGAPVIVVYEFWSDQQRLLRTIKGSRVLRTVEDEDDFKAGKIPVLLLHPKSGGHGIDGFQHACHHMIFFGQSWNLEEYQQVVERIGPTRQAQSGYDRNVFLYMLIGQNTIDEDVLDRRRGKEVDQAELMAAMKRRQST